VARRREGRPTELAGPTTNLVAAEPRRPTSRPARRRREPANSVRGPPPAHRGDGARGERRHPLIGGWRTWPRTCPTAPQTGRVGLDFGRWQSMNGWGPYRTRVVQPTLGEKAPPLSRNVAHPTIYIRWSWDFSRMNQQSYSIHTPRLQAPRCKHLAFEREEHVVSHSY
jgi:hypothetical protein